MTILSVPTRWCRNAMPIDMTEIMTPSHPEVTASLTWKSVQCRGVQMDGDSGNPAESGGMGLNVAGIPRGWIWQLRDYRGDGFFFDDR